MQAQYAPSPYVALWSRIEGFRKEQLTRALSAGSIVKAGSLRTTLHVMSAAEFPYLASAYVESRARPDGAASASMSRRCARRCPTSRSPAPSSSSWVTACSAPMIAGRLRSPIARCRSCAPRRLASGRTRSPRRSSSGGSRCPSHARARSASCGSTSRRTARRRETTSPSTRRSRLRQIDPALEGLPTLTDDEGRTLYDVRGAPRAAGDVPAPVRFLPAFDSIILAHRDRSRIVPPEYRRRGVQQAQCDDEEHVHRRRVRRRRVAGRTQEAGARAVRARCPRACGARWTPRASGCSPGISARGRRSSN